MKLSDYLTEFLVSQGIKHVFQIIGGASVHMVDSIARNKNISYICTQHEQSAAIAAESYARMTKNLGCAMATSGPGMTNLITGIACAYFDSIPVIYITGQVNTFEAKGKRKVRQVGFQETDIVTMVKPITKYSVQITDPKKIRYVLEKAVHIAESDRPGPVLIDIPMDIQRADIDVKKLFSFLPLNNKAGDAREGSHTEMYRSMGYSSGRTRIKIIKTLNLLLQSKRPVLIAGGAIRYADMATPFRKLVDLLGIPVVATWSGIDALPHDHPLYIGQIGVYGNRAANFAIQNSDLVISLGSRLDTRITGGKPETFARFAKKVIIDIDRHEIHKKRGLNPDIAIIENVKYVIPTFIKEYMNIKLGDAREGSRIAPQRIPPVGGWSEHETGYSSGRTQKLIFFEWIKQTQTWKEKYPSVLPEWYKLKDKVNPYVFIKTLSTLLSDNAVTVTDCGANLTWTIQGFHVKENQRLYSAMGNSPMGYSVSSAIGASFGLGKKEIICITGDGGLQLNIQELQTIFHYKIPLKIFILNNHSYGIIKQFQEMYFGGKYEGTTPETGYSVPDFLKIAKAYGIKTATIRNHKEMPSKIKHVLKHKGPVICDVIVPDDTKLIPKLEFGKPIEDLSPLLPRDEFEKNMLIPLID
jgi:acetolactate synthase I/II/III large subunit